MPQSESDYNSVKSDLAYAERRDAKSLLYPWGYREIKTPPDLTDRVMTVFQSLNCDSVQVFNTFMCQLEGRINLLTMVEVSKNNALSNIVYIDFATVKNGDLHLEPRWAGCMIPLKGVNNTAKMVHPMLAVEQLMVSLEQKGITPPAHIADTRMQSAEDQMRKQLAMYGGKGIPVETCTA